VGHDAFIDDPVNVQTPRTPLAGTRAPAPIEVVQPPLPSAVRITSPHCIEYWASVPE